MAHRVHNFNAGPAALPLPALERAQRELVDFEGSGMSIMEHSHRGKEYEAVHDEAISLLTEILGVPATHQVLFLQGGASQQFAQLPMNFLPAGKSSDYVVTGAWGEKAVEEAQFVGTVRVAASTERDKAYTRVPTDAELKIDPAAAYVHYTTNETIHGVEFHRVPEVGKAHLVADMSSDFLWKPIDVSRYALIYAGAQKNIGPSGVTVVIVRKDWADQGRKDIPKIFRYSTAIANNSLYNTAPTFGIYLVRNVLAWLKERGGLPTIERDNRKKADALYAVMDANPDFYRAPVEKASRSVMNLVFRLPSTELEDRFVSEAKKQGMIGLKGHRSVGGIRVSAYNAVSVASCEALASFMRLFVAKS